MMSVCYPVPPPLDYPPISTAEDFAPGGRLLLPDDGIIDHVAVQRVAHGGVARLTRRELNLAITLARRLGREDEGAIVRRLGRRAILSVADIEARNRWRKRQSRHDPEDRRRHYEAHREEILAYQRAKRATPEAREAARRYRQAHQDKINEGKRRYYERNRDRIIEAKRRRRAGGSASGPVGSPQDHPSAGG